MLHRILLLVVGSLLLIAQPCAAGVVMTFWSHDQDESFPHAFFALKGVPDAGGQAIDTNYGFTAKSVTPAILLGSVGGRVEDSKPGYMRRSDARFSVMLTDAQLTAVQALVAEWSTNSDYNLNKRNCVHFVAEAARRAGLLVPHLPKLMKKPRSFLVAVGAANADRVTPLNLAGPEYFASHGAAEIAAAPAPAPVSDTPSAVGTDERR